MSRLLLDVQHLSISLPSGLSLVDDVSFQLNEGEILGLVGESGSGKTLTCRALIQLLPSDQLAISYGQAFFENQNILTMNDKQLRELRGKGIGMIFQNPSVHINPLMTVGSQVVESLNITAKMSRKLAQEKAIEILSRVGIPSPQLRFHSYIHEFSGGMKQRAMIAIALAASPKVLIADEPTTALDVTVQAQILKLLDQLRVELGLSIILITHDLGVVAQTCDRVAVLYGGRVCEVASTPSLLSKPQHPYTKGLIGCQPLSDSSKGLLTAIAGSPPTANTMPTGCRFHPRCLFATSECYEQQPPQVETIIDGQDHIIACHHPIVASSLVEDANV